MAQPSLTLYTAKTCPYAHRVEIALHEVGAKYKEYVIDLANKPDWYAPKVNPASKVPAITVGGPHVDPSDPSPESTKLAESLVLVEFIADLFPSHPFRPSDPVLRAKGRFFIDQLGVNITQRQNAWVMRGAENSAEELIQGLEKQQALLPKDAKFALGGAFTFADAAAAGHIARLNLSLKHDLGKYASGEGKKFAEVLQSDRLKRWHRYMQDVLAQKSLQDTFKEDVILKSWNKRFASRNA